MGERDSVFLHEYCRANEGKIARRLLVPSLELAVGGERYAPGAGAWFLLPSPPGADFETISRTAAAAELGERALARGGEATSLVDVEEPPPPNDRARWLVDRIVAVQRWVRLEVDDIGGFDGVEPRSSEWGSEVRRSRDLRATLHQLFLLWDELRMIQALELTRSPEF